MSRTSKVLAAALVALLVGMVVGKYTLSRKRAVEMATAAAAGHHGAHHGAAPVGIDWTRVSDRDLDIAELFVIARRSGVGEALKRLETLAASDPALRDMGHVIAHGLGRFVVAQRGGDPGVYSDCREAFQAGCNHGVMEAYFSSARAAPASAVSPATLDSLCSRITRPGAARLVSLECAHGMGHGLVARFEGDVRQALGACDHLTQRDARDECHDGVFMENAVRGTTSADMRVGDAAVRAGAAGREQKPLVRRDDLAYPCTEIEQPYKSSCWKYQAVIIVEATRRDEARTFAVCEQAPEAFRGDCFFGIGKQGTGWWPDQQHVAQLCAHVPMPHRGACIAGAVESYLDEMWTVDRAMGFCAVVAADSKADCYQAIGSRLALMRTDYSIIERECARSERGFVPACVKGVALVWLRR